MSEFGAWFAVGAIPFGLTCLVCIIWAVFWDFIPDAWRSLRREPWYLQAMSFSFLTGLAIEIVRLIWRCL